MADPISIMAVAGLVYAGRNLGKRAEKAESVPQQDKVQVQVQKQEPEIDKNSYGMRVGVPHKREMESFAAAKWWSRNFEHAESYV